MSLHERIVCRVVDGDTVEVCNRQRKHKRKVRLYGIDAPEAKQSYGPEATAALTLMLEATNNRVYMQAHGLEKWGRELATLYTVRKPKLASQNINYMMILGGHAWSYRFTRTEGIRHKPLVPELDSYDSAQTDAKLGGRGLWSRHLSPPMQPSEYRRAKRRQERHKTVEKALDKIDTFFDPRHAAAERRTRQAQLEVTNSGEGGSTASEESSEES
jgi:micrococcal nuclease